MLRRTSCCGPARASEDAIQRLDAAVDLVEGVVVHHGNSCDAGLRIQPQRLDEPVGVEVAEAAADLLPGQGRDDRLGVQQHSHQE